MYRGTQKHEVPFFLKYFQSDRLAALLTTPQAFVENRFIARQQTSKRLPPQKCKYIIIELPPPPLSKICHFAYIK